jgi:4-diphosphocytidyl-2-C-methyl-D-erythritol kinase
VGTSALNGPWPAPAKLNLFLHVTGRRADGYHTLQTVFQFLDHGDRLRFELRDDARIARAAPVAQVPEEEDLTLRAARLLARRTGCRRGATVQLEKRLPVGGGLGGGSSDAATVLVALNRLWGAGLSIDELAALGAQLGADVPVFVRGRAAWAEGVGEVLTPVDLPEPWYVVLVPGVRVSTAEVFAEYAGSRPKGDLTAYSAPIRIRDFRAGRAVNDLEALVRRRYPPVDRAFTWLSRYGDARLTGTGACVFAEMPERDEAQAVLAGLPPDLTGFAARGRNRSALLDAAAK